MTNRFPKIILISNSSHRYMNLLFSNMKNYIPGLSLKNVKHHQLLYSNHPRDILLFFTLLSFFDSDFKATFESWTQTKGEKLLPISDSNLELLDDNFIESFEDIEEELQPRTPTKRKKLHIKYKFKPYLFSDRQYFENWTLSQTQTYYAIHSILLDGKVHISESMLKNLLDLYDNNSILKNLQLNYLAVFFYANLKLLHYLFFIIWMRKLYNLNLLNVKFTTAR